MNKLKPIIWSQMLGLFFLNILGQIFIVPYVCLVAITEFDGNPNLKYFFIEVSQELAQIVTF